MTFLLFTTLVMHLCKNIETLILVAGCVLYDFDILVNVSPVNFVSNGKQCIPSLWLSEYEILFIQTRVFVQRHKNIALNTFMTTAKELLAEFFRYKASCISHELTLLFSLLHV